MSGAALRLSDLLAMLSRGLGVALPPALAMMLPRNATVPTGKVRELVNLMNAACDAAESESRDGAQGSQDPDHG